MNLKVSATLKILKSLTDMERNNNVPIARLMDAIFGRKSMRLVLRLLSREELIQFLSLKFKEKCKTEEEQIDSGKRQ